MKRSSLLNRVAAAVELPIKQALFGCRACGSCLLSQTHLVCPMNCPKGLRNGPCGGTLNGMCEVLPDRRCVWMRIRGKDVLDVEPPEIRHPFDPDLLGTSSYLNYASGADAPTREPFSIPRWREAFPGRTRSGLEGILLSGRRAITTELRSPRTLKGLPRVARDVKKLLPWVDGFNTTSHAGGHRGVSSLETARVVVAEGGEAIVQACGRDVTPAAFLEELIAASEAGIHNLLCLTGDWPADGPRSRLSSAAARREFFPMDSSQMILEARHISEKGVSLYNMREYIRPLSFFIGAAANPYSTPVKAAAERIAQKACCGADFVQTQIVCDVDGFCEWREQLLKNESSRHLKILASIPVVGGVKSLDVLRGIPGVFLPEEVDIRLRGAADIQESGLDFAAEIMRVLLARRAVDGFHLVPFGASADAVAEVAIRGRAMFEHDNQVTETCQS